MLFFIRSIFVQFFLNAYFIYRIRKSKLIHKHLKWVLYILLIVETVLSFVGFFGRNSMPFESYVLIQKISVFWTVGSFYWLFLLLGFDLIFYLNKKWIFRIKFKDQTIRILGVIVFLLFFSHVGYYFRSPKDNYLEPQVKNLSFKFDLVHNESDTIETKSDYKLLVVSDLHLGYLIDKKVLRKYVDFINTQQADIVVINGDLIDYYLEPLKEQRMEEELMRLQAPYGVYFILGNHEYKKDAEANFEWIRQSGISILWDSVVTIGKLQLIGRDDLENEDSRKEWTQLMAQTDSSKALVFFTHQPNDRKDAIANNIPLIISGHTHDGQIFPMNWLTFLFHSHSHGTKIEGESYLYTTSGLGLSGFPFRISTESEVVIFHIHIR